jgi:antitoxin ParD1/3/4
MPARNVSLTNHFVQFLDDNVESGRFQNASEVVREGLRLLEQQQRRDEAKLEALRAMIDEARAGVRRGEVTEIEPGEELAFVQSLGRGGQPA